MRKEKMQSLLCALLDDCGYRDLELLSDCEYDMIDVVEQARSMGFEKLDINNLAYAMFDIGKGDIQTFIENRIDELERMEELDSIENEELESLKELDAYGDIKSFHNYIDTSIWISKNKEIYAKYLSHALDIFSENTGFDIG